MSKLFYIFFITVSLFCISNSGGMKEVADKSTCISQINIDQETLYNSFRNFILNEDIPAPVQHSRTIGRNDQRMILIKNLNRPLPVSHGFLPRNDYNNQYKALLYTQGFYLYFMRELII